MQHQLLGSTGLAVSRFAFGAMTFGEGALVPGVDNAIGEDKARAMVDRCLERGINLFDTADMYTSGQSEVLLGKALGDRRKDVLIATKCGFRSGESVNARGGSYAYVTRAIDDSLRRLNSEWIDIFFLHIPDPWTPIDQSLRALEDATRAGKIRYAGLSNFPAHKAARMLGRQETLGFAPLQVTQMYYSLLGRDLEDGYADFLEAEGIGLMTWSPLASGYLTGKYSGGQDSGGRRKNFSFPPVDTDLGDKVVGALKEIGAAHDASPAQVALAWQLSRTWVTSVLIGASSVAQLDENLKAADIALTDEDVRRLDEVSAFTPRYPGWMQPMGADEATRNALC